MSFADSVDSGKSEQVGGAAQWNEPHYDIACGAISCVAASAPTFTSFMDRSEVPGKQLPNSDDRCEAATVHLDDTLTEILLFALYIGIFLIAIAVAGLLCYFINNAKTMATSTHLAANASYHPGELAGSHETKEFKLDTGANCHITNQYDWFSDYSPRRSEFKVVGGKSTSLGTGTVLFNPTDDNGNRSVTVRLANVHFIPSSSFNLISHSKLKAAGFSVDFDELKVRYGGKVFSFQEYSGIYPWSESVLASSSMAPAPFVSMALDSQGRDTWDWQFIRSEFAALNEKYGPFDIELFRNDNNSLLEEGYNEIQNAFNQPWAGKSNYGKPGSFTACSPRLWLTSTPAPQTPSSCSCCPNGNLRTGGTSPSTLS